MEFVMPQIPVMLLLLGASSFWTSGNLLLKCAADANDARLLGASFVA